MKTLFKFIGAGALVAAGWFGWAFVLSSNAVATEIKLEPTAHAVYDPKKIDLDIQFHEGRVERDPSGAIGWRMLANAYLARSNESDLDVFAWKAEDAARRSIELRANLNSSAFNSLTRSLLEQHRFQDAVVQAKANVQQFPDDTSAHLLLVDALIEVGKISEAAAALKLVPGGPNPMVNVASARVNRANGNSDYALSLLKSALIEFESSAAISDQTLAWLHHQIGSIHESAKDTNGAETYYKQALKLHSRSYKATLGLARIALATKRLDEAVKWANQTLTVAHSLDAIAILGDAKLARGDRQGAQVHYDEARTLYLEEVAKFDELGKGGKFKVKPIDRQFATFAATHEMFVAEALEAAKRDFANRPDKLAASNLEGLKKLANK